ncbi:OB-fold nucleic acid binding domain-containing protein [Angustibacter aerolatus]
MGHAQTTSPGRLRSALHKLTSSDRVLEAEDLREEAGRLGGTPVADLPDRQMACVCGTVRSVTLRPRAGVPALVAELYDGSGVLKVVWLGRRQIQGIQAGAKLRVRGRVAQRDGKSIVFNPSYELLSGCE